MNKILALIAIIPLYACGGDTLVCENMAAGSCIFTNGLDVSLEEIDILVDILEGEIQERYPEITDISTAFDDMDVIVNFVDGDLAINCEQVDHAPGNLKTCTNIGGVNYGYRNIYVEYFPCLAYTSLAHEFLHSVENYYMGVHDSQHDTEWFFEKYYRDQGLNPTVSIEWQTMREAVYTLDSCDYLF